MAWGSYILLNRTLGPRLPGLHGTAVASLVTAAVWTPITVAWFAVHTPPAPAIARSRLRADVVDRALRR